jgi:cell division septal protein FtsQ
MQRERIKTKYVRKKRRLVFILISLCLIGLVILIILSRLGKKELFISPITGISNQDAKKIETILINAQITYASITLEADSSYVVKLQDGGEVILSLKKNIDKQITSLQLILKQLTIDGKRFNRIDFRFDKPLVVYE